jgi:hypothetical protein
MSLVYVRDKETSEVFAEHDGASKESFCRGREFLSSRMGVSAFQESGQTWSVGRAFRGRESPRLVLALLPDLLED